MGHELRHHTAAGHATAASLYHHHDRHPTHAATPGRHTRVEPASTHGRDDGQEHVGAGCSSHLVVCMLHAQTPWGQYEEYGQCMDGLIDGRETVDCHEDHVTDDKAIASLAELAQDLPLSMLEGN